MAHLSARTLRFLNDRDSGAVIEDVHVERCEFEGCILSLTRDPNLRSTVRNATLTSCTVTGGGIYSALLEDVVVEGLATAAPLLVCAAAFKHVVLKGRIGSVVLRPFVIPGVTSPAEDEVFRRANREYYRSVDWAIDISEAEAKDLDLAGVPGALIRRDPERSVLVRRDRMVGGRWKLPGVLNTQPRSIRQARHRGFPHSPQRSIGRWLIAEASCHKDHVGVNGSDQRDPASGCIRRK